MADLNIAGLHNQQVYTGPDGNLSRHHVIWDESALAVADAVYAAPLPQGMKIFEVKVLVTDGHASSNIDVGHKQRGAGSWADDTDYWHDGISIASIAEFSSIDDSHKAPVLIDEPDVFLYVDLKGAAIAAQTVVHFIIDYEYEGNL